MFSDFEKYENISDEWEPPTEEPYASQGNRKSHLLEPDACDQFGLVHDGGDKVIFASFRATSLQWEAEYRPFESHKHLDTKFFVVTILSILIGKQGPPTGQLSRLKALSVDHFLPHELLLV